MATLLIISIILNVTLLVAISPLMALTVDGAPAPIKILVRAITLPGALLFMALCGGLKDFDLGDYFRI